MSHVIVHNTPFATGFRAAQNGAKELLQRDRARAAKLLAGTSHGPHAFLESFRYSKHCGKTGTLAFLAHENTRRSVNVTDTGMLAIHRADNKDARFTYVPQV